MGWEGEKLTMSPFTILRSTSFYGVSRPPGSILKDELKENNSAVTEGKTKTGKRDTR